MVIYSFFLYYEYKQYGIIQYPFTNFSQGNQAWYNLMAIGGGAILFYLICVHFDKKLKNMLEMLDQEKRQPKRELQLEE